MELRLLAWNDSFQLDSAGRSVTVEAAPSGGRAVRKPMRSPIWVEHLQCRWFAVAMQWASTLVSLGQQLPLASAWTMTVVLAPDSDEE